jgi:hypothetical protein
MSIISCDTSLVQFYIAPLPLVVTSHRIINPRFTLKGSTGNSKGKRKVKRAEILDTDIPEIVEPTEEDVTPNIEGLLGGPSLFGGEDVDLENLLVGLIPQPPTSASGSSDEVILP